MAINIRHTHSAHVEITFYAEDGITLRCRDCGQMDDIAEHVCVNLVQHKFVSADVCSAETGEVLMIIERT